MKDTIQNDLKESKNTQAIVAPEENYLDELKDKIQASKLKEKRNTIMEENRRYLMDNSKRRNL